MSTQRKAITLVEISIVSVLAFLIIGSILNVFSSGIKGSTRNLTHQDNMETANILMSQIEFDLLKVNEIISPDWNQEGNKAIMVMKSSSSLGDIVFSYDNDPTSQNGVHRYVKGNNFEENNYFAKNHPVKLNFTHVVINSTNSNNNERLFIEKHAMWVELEVGSAKGDVASYTLKRLITLKSQI